MVCIAKGRIRCHNIRALYFLNIFRKSNQLFSSMYYEYANDNTINSILIYIEKNITSVKLISGMTISQYTGNQLPFTIDATTNALDTNLS